MKTNNSFLKQLNNAKYSGVYWALLVFSVIGLICAFVLTNEKIEILKNANASLSCSINAVINCGPVIRSHQASAFGFSNTLIGLMSFPALITIAVLGLTGVQFKKWFMVGLEIGTALGFIFAYWLLFQSAVVIDALCPYCIATTFSTTIIFAVVTHLNFSEGNLYLRTGARSTLQKWAKNRYDTYFWVVWIAVIVALLIVRFRSHI
jgi:uncharacterized membrane protein